MSPAGALLDEYLSESKIAQQLRVQLVAQIWSMKPKRSIGHLMNSSVNNCMGRVMCQCTRSSEYGVI